MSTLTKRRPTVFTGQVGTNKGPFIEKVRGHLEGLLGSKAISLSTGDLMYAEDPKIRPGEILKFGEPMLRALRRSIMHKVFEAAAGDRHLLLNTHATFRWAHGLFEAQDFDHLEKLAPALMINVIDNVHEVQARNRECSIPHSLMDCLVSREAELNFTQSYTRFCNFQLQKESGVKQSTQFFVVARGPNDRRAESVAKLIANPTQLKIYPSFPMTHVYHMPDVMARITAFRDRLADHAIVFDPGDVDEKLFTIAAGKAKAAGKSDFGFLCNGQEVLFNCEEVLSIDREVDRQICDRDFKQIDQSDMIVSFIPEIPGADPENPIPGLSSGVERELHHGFLGGQDVYVVWTPKRAPSPFISNHARGVFRSEDELIAHLIEEGKISAKAPEPAQQAAA